MVEAGCCVSIEKTPNGRFRAHLKSGRVKVATRTFDTRREAVAWLTRERAALDGGIDPRAGKERVRDLLPRWLEIRRTTVAAKTWQTDRELLRLVPTSMMALQVSSVRGREVARSFEALLSRGLGHTSVVRYRASLSVFFAWWVREKLIATNPVTAVRVPKSSVPPVELHPFTEDELEAVHDAWALRDPRLADVMLVLGWTGLRWAEARELRVGDFVEVPSPALLVRRSAPEGVGVKATKSGRSRRVPVANRVLPIIKRFTLGKGPDDLLLTTYMGAQLHRNAVVRTLDWKHTAQGRRIHDLRHTAACLWLARGVDPGTVQAWMGHESIATTNRYLHHLGTAADIAGLARLNASLDEGLGTAGGPREVAQ
nr:tyrosine-type recombinase/integrase [Cutibacterium avidum]